MKGRPQEETIKEAYALFGLAYFHSECLHRGLCHVYALSLLPQRPLVSRPRFEEVLVRSYSLTLGQVTEKLNGSFDQDLFDRLTDAAKRRNFLAHHFWFERCHLMSSETGLLELHQELSEMSSLFHNLDLEVADITLPRLEALGISEEKLAISLEAALAGEPMDPLLSQRFSKKQERLVRAWDVPTSNGSTLVFQTADGVLWQLCDVGLGWTIFENCQPNWTINDEIQKHLPATVISRPSSSAPWNYDIELRNNMVLAVRPPLKDSAFRWTLRRKR